jgi:peptidoglycan hydrolase FlgJ
MPAIPNSQHNTAVVSTSLIKPTTGNSLALDTRSLEALKARAGTDPKGAVRETSRQFETLFMGEMVKSMRAATPTTGLMDNPGSQLGTEMLDKQLASQISARPGGLSDVIMKQLERQMGVPPGPVPGTESGSNAFEPLRTPLARQPVDKPQANRVAPTPALKTPQAGAANFVQRHMDAARTAEASSGIPASFMVSQAALETGWGRKEIKHTDGSPSYNLFGIKAGGSWQGSVAEVPTTEFINGKATRVLAKFRAYGSYAESFSDYAQMVSSSPRYQAVRKGVDAVQLASAPSRDAGVAFAQNMQRAGYATDPEYAGKLSRVINTTLRLQRSMVA